VRRLVVYAVLLLLLVGGGLAFWLHTVPLQVERAVRKLGHPNAEVASEGWTELHQLYRTKWAAVYPTLAHAEDDAPISFLVERRGAPFSDRPELEGFWGSPKPRYHKTDQIWCRTVGDAIRAILYNENDAQGRPRWRTDLDGDWDAWWRANQGHYGL
jgi:hypothetical protein